MERSHSGPRGVYSRSGKGRCRANDQRLRKGAAGAVDHGQCRSCQAPPRRTCFKGKSDEMISQASKGPPLERLGEPDEDRELLRFSLARKASGLTAG